jgi:hypothetical protein
MSGINNTRVYENILGPSTNPNNLDIYNEFVDEEDNEEYDTQLFNFDPTGFNRNRNLDVGELVAEVTKKDINASKMRGFNMMDYGTAIDLGVISPNVTEYEFEQLKQGNITEPGTYTI